MTLRKLVAGNWKMHGDRASLAEVDAIAHGVAGCAVDVAICPPFTLIAGVAARADQLLVGAQDCHAAASGAHTGSVSAVMLVEAGATLAIVGHSERRAAHGETDADVRAKADAVIAAGMTAIVCVGETLGQREAGEALAVVRRQLAGSLPDARDRLVVAYEPVWAVGTGRTPSVADVTEMHAAIRAILRVATGGDSVRILYGGSVNASNAAQLMAIDDVDGVLVGGASLSASDFVPIVRAAA